MKKETQKSTEVTDERLVAPSYCQYAGGACDQLFNSLPSSKGLFLYPSEPTQIASTIEASIVNLNSRSSDNWSSWKNFGVAGQIIFCTICKNMRGAEFIVADVTTLNFNLLFEIGFALGLGIPVVPIRDTSTLSFTK